MANQLEADLSEQVNTCREGMAKIFLKQSEFEKVEEQTDLILGSELTQNGGIYFLRAQVRFKLGNN